MRHPTQLALSVRHNKVLLIWLLQCVPYFSHLDLIFYLFILLAYRNPEETMSPLKGLKTENRRKPFLMTRHFIKAVFVLLTIRTIDNGALTIRMSV